MPGREAWKLDDGEYSVDRFYVQSTDGKGHGDEVRVRVPPYLASQLQAIFESRTFPKYRTVADIVRDAIYHRLRYLELRQHGEASDALKLIGFQERLRQNREAFETATASVNALSQTVEELLRAGAEPRARSLVADALEQAPADADVRAHYLRQLRAKFGHWLGEKEEG